MRRCSHVGQYIECTGNFTLWSNAKKWLSLHAYLAGGGSRFNFAESQFLPTTKEYIFYLTTKFVENIEKVPPTQSQINNNKPTNYLSNMMRSNQ